MLSPQNLPSCLTTPYRMYNDDHTENHKKDRNDQLKSFNINTAVPALNAFTRASVL